MPYPEAVRFESGDAGVMPVVTLFGLDPDRCAPLAFKESWSLCLAETAVAAGSVPAFLHEAVRFCNERVEGTLSVKILASDRSRRGLGREFDRALQALHYGTIGINYWTAVSFALAVAPWGSSRPHAR
jgi:hypothetical protein